MCIPQVDELKQAILDEAYKSRLSFHLGSTKMYQYLKKNFWWNGMKKDVARYVAKCLTCCKMKVEHQQAPREIQPLEIPEWKWNNISMDFVSGLPRMRHNYGVIWVIVDQLTKSSYFIPINMKYKLEKLIELYIKEVFKLHGVPLSIVFDRGPHFTSRFWVCLQKSFGNEVEAYFSVSSINQQTCRTNQSIFRGSFKGMHDGATRRLG